MHVDHVVTFDELQRRWGGTDQVVVGPHMVMSDSVQLHSWRAFHAEHAELRMLCARCNLTRPRKP